MVMLHADKAVIMTTQKQLINLYVCDKLEIFGKDTKKSKFHARRTAE
jgi:hypothetical protein